MAYKLLCEVLTKDNNQTAGDERTRSEKKACQPLQKSEGLWNDGY